VLGVVGVIEDASRAIGRAFRAASRFQAPGSRTGLTPGRDNIRSPEPGATSQAVIVLLGENYGELGGSEYLHALHGMLNGEPPRLDLDAERRLQRFLVDAVADGLLLSAHDCAEGGLAVTVAECCFDTGSGAEVDVPPAGVDHGLIVETTLFGESASRVVVSVEEHRADELLARALAAGVPAASIGRTGGTRLVMRVGGEAAIDVAIVDAEHAWSSALDTHFARRTA
jgi:phosphoribosylformylglycinamidine synthase